MSLDKPSILGRIKGLIKGLLQPARGGPEAGIPPIADGCEIHSAPSKPDGLSRGNAPVPISEPIASSTPSITPSERPSSTASTPPSPSSMPPAPTAKPKFLASYCKEIATQAKLPEAQVRLVCELFLKGILDQLRAGIPFSSWMVNITPEPLPAAKAPGAKPKQSASLPVTVQQATGFSDDRFKKQVLSRLKA